MKQPEEDLRNGYMQGSTPARQVRAALAFTNTFEIEANIKLEEKQEALKTAQAENIPSTVL